MVKLLNILLLALLHTPFTQAQSKPDGLHCLGNGRYCVYEQGVNIRDLFGPSYSSPNYIQSYLQDSTISVTSRRIPGTAIWNHVLTRQQSAIAEITDFVDSDLPVMVRKIKATASIHFLVKIRSNTAVQAFNNDYDYTSGPSGVLLVHKDRGLNIMQDYAHPYEQFQQVMLRGNAKIAATDTAGIYNITVQPGESELFFIGGPDYSECIGNAKKVLVTDYSTLLRRTRAYWATYTKKRKDFRSLIPDSNPDKAAILEQIDNVSILLKTQQGSEGGVVAGQEYHMAYVRDQYGVSRGYLALGYYEEARMILDFYWKIWLQFGLLHNAQAIGIPGVFHIHENDEVELTGYLIVQAFDYLKATRDSVYMKKITPMLQWAWQAQKRHLVKYMLPFNGDETYVAGGLLPRTALNDGSAESTLLFIRNGGSLLPYLQKNHLWHADSIHRDQQLVEAVTAHYRENFISEGRLMTNNPARMTVAEMPQFRHGVCAGPIFGIVWTEKDANGNYLCPKCRALGKYYPPIERKPYFLSSIALDFIFMDAGLIPDEIAANIQLIKKKYAASGSVSSEPGSKTVIGYEYGFLLYALAKMHDPLAKNVFTDMMSVVDGAGAWVEYYDNGQPKGCRYRPWESAVNIAAIIAYCSSRP
jgi:hypothetical protein